MSKIVFQGTQFAKITITSIREFRYSSKPYTDSRGVQQTRKLYYTTAEAHLSFPNGTPMGYTEGNVILTIFETTTDDFQNAAKQPHIHGAEELIFTELPFEPRNSTNSRFVPYGMLGQIKLNLSDISDARTRTLPAPTPVVVAPTTATPTVAVTPTVDTAELERVTRLVETKKQELARYEQDITNARENYRKQAEAFDKARMEANNAVQLLQEQKRRLEDDLRVKDGELDGTRKEIVEGLFKRLPIDINQVERLTVDITALLQGRNAFLWKVKKTQ